MDKVLNMTYASSLTDLCEVNSSFDKGILRICYTGENKNGSFISKKVIEKCLPSIYNCPLVCNYDRESDTLGGHDMEVVRDSEGSLRIINSTTPLGVIPESSRVWFENYEENDDTVHEYLYAEVLIWKRQEAYKKIKKDGVAAHSMEIKVNEGRSIDGIYHVEDFEFNAFCLIGETPCFEGSALEMFSAKDFKQQLSEMMRDLKDTFNTVNPSKEDDNIYIKNYSMEGGRKVLDEKMKIAAEYGVDVDSLDFSIEDLTIEELTEKFKAMKVISGRSEPDNESDKKFALTGNVVDEIRRVLSMEQITDEWGDNIPHYFYIDCDFDAKEVYCWDSCDWLLYGFAYLVDGDSVTIDFGSRKRKKYVISDFEGKVQDSPISQVFEIMGNKLNEYSEFEAKFNEASNTIASMQSEIDALKKFKSEAEEAEEQEAREKVFSQFEDLNGIDAFEALKENRFEYDVSSLEEKCFAIRGRNATALKFSTKEKVPKLRVEQAGKVKLSDEPYGGLIEKYNLNK